MRIMPDICGFLERHLRCQRALHWVQDRGHDLHAALKAEAMQTARMGLHAVQLEQHAQRPDIVAAQYCTGCTCLTMLAGPCCSNPAATGHLPHQIPPPPAPNPPPKDSLMS